MTAITKNNKVKKDEDTNAVQMCVLIISAHLVKQ